MTTVAATALRAQLSRQVAHWHAATSALGELDGFASTSAWASLEQYLGLALRRHLAGAVDRLRLEAETLAVELRRTRSEADLQRLHRAVVVFRARFLRTEMMMDFYGDAVNTRTNPRLAALLAANDIIAVQGLAAALQPLGLETPPVLCYREKGNGAAITKYGLRLWDEGSLSPVAAIKITGQSLPGTPSVFHEIGHQYAHCTGWTPELAASFDRELGRTSPGVAAAWAGWSSEVNADAFAFVHAGFAAVANLHDVVAGANASVFACPPGDPHPMPYLRVMLGARMCRCVFGPGPWDELVTAWVRSYPMSEAPGVVRELIDGSLAQLDTIVELCLFTPMRAFGGRPLAAVVDPLAVGPARLTRLEADMRRGMGRSTHWLWRECTRLLALSGFMLTTAPEQSARLLAEQEAWMVRLGRTAAGAAA